MGSDPDCVSIYPGPAFRIDELVGDDVSQTDMVLLGAMFDGQLTTGFLNILRSQPVGATQDCLHLRDWSFFLIPNEWPTRIPASDLSAKEEKVAAPFCNGLHLLAQSD